MHPLVCALLLLNITHDTDEHVEQVEAERESGQDKYHPEVLGLRA
jgi:hypothetical protein